MMAAATPRLLLRALRAQRFRGPVWCCGAVRGAATAEGKPPLTPPPPPEPPNFVEIPPNPDKIPPNSAGISPNSDRIPPNSVEISPNSVGISPNFVENSPNSVENSPNSVGISPNSDGISPKSVENSPNSVENSPNFDGNSPNFDGISPNFGVNSPDLGEPRLEELGLGGSTPVGLIQNLLEFLHLDLGLPWWGAIAAGTVGARVLLLPLVLRGQREAARLSRHLPQLQRLSQRLAEARRGADPNQVAVAYSDLASYQRRHDVNPLRGFLVPLVQGMAAAPVPGLLRGGLAWFPNLAAPDPFYVLPVLVTASTWLVLELGAETGVAAPGAGPVRQILRLLPLFFLPFIIHFPTAVFTYWLTSNSFSLLQTGLLRVPALRAKLGVAPPLATPLATPTGPAPPSKGGILKQLKKEWREAQATHEAEQRRWRLRNHLQLAAKGPLRQTFAQNPLSSPGAAPAAPSESPKRPWKDTLG